MSFPIKIWSVMMAHKDLSKDAQMIVDAGVVAMESGNNVERAVDEAIGDLFTRYTGTGRAEAAPIDALKEIAVLCVELKLQPRYKAA